MKRGLLPSYKFSSSISSIFTRFLIFYGLPRIIYFFIALHRSQKIISLYKIQEKGPKCKTQFSNGKIKKLESWPQSKLIKT